jgi:hypothetical protein
MDENKGTKFYQERKTSFMSGSTNKSHPIIFHQVGHPNGLLYFSDWLKLFKHGLYVQYRCAIDRIKIFYEDGAATMLHQFNGAKSDRVRPVFFMLAKDTDFWIIRISSRLPENTMSDLFTLSK